MAQLYFRMGIHERPAQFDHFFRRYPDYGIHQAGYCVNAGLDWLLDWTSSVRCGDDDIAALKTQTGRAGSRVFQDDFLDWLKSNGSYESLSIRAVAEGRAVHPDEPLTIVQGPLALAQIYETSLLAQLNYQTLIATKAARIRQSARSRPVLEFGMRRGADSGVVAGARAALIGGADFSSNVGASHAFGLPPKGTHAHSMVQAFMALGEGELGAFRAYAEAYPDDCLLLVDTIDTLNSGVPNAIRVFEELKAKGHKPAGVRLDSGDLAFLSLKTSKMLNDAGFKDASIVLSNQLDELTILQIVSQIQDEAPAHGIDADSVINRLIFGVGTRLIASQGHPALDGVYKLTAIQDSGRWQPAVKVSETPAKTINPGEKRVWRLYDKRGKATADLVTLSDESPDEWGRIRLRHPSESSKERALSKQEISEMEELLEPVFAEGQRIGEAPTLDEIRKQRENDIERLDSGVKRIINPHEYHVSLSQSLWEKKQELIRQARES